MHLLDNKKNCRFCHVIYVIYVTYVMGVTWEKSSHGAKRVNKAAPISANSSAALTRSSAANCAVNTCKYKIID